MMLRQEQMDKEQVEEGDIGEDERKLRKLDN
jgi:hypothetical protein